jgi:hypothetical protein
MKTHFHFYADPGHGWLAVTQDDIKDVGLSVADFSRYSYHNGETLYLEEDCDASLFLAAYQVKYCRQPEIIEHVEAHGDSIVRSYGRLPDTARGFDGFAAKMKHFRAIIDNRAEA